MLTEQQRLHGILDLAEARLRNGPLDPNVEHDLREIANLARTPPSRFCAKCPFAEHLHPTPYGCEFEAL